MVLGKTHDEKYKRIKKYTSVIIAMIPRFLKFVVPISLLLIVIAFYLLNLASADPAVQRPLKFWKDFQDINSAWLLPNPSALSYEIILQRKDFDPENGIYSWCDSELIQTWCTPDRNLRLIVKHIGQAEEEKDIEEERYFHGKGNRVTIPPKGRLKDLRQDKLLAGRIGTAFLTSLHLIACWGVPNTATVEDKDDNTILFRASDLGASNRKWYKDTWVHPMYGLHPFAFGSHAEVYPETIEVAVDRKTKLPLNIVEIDNKGMTQATIHFDRPWLILSGKKVPKTIKCSLPQRERNLTYQFAVDQGLWFLKELIDIHSSNDSLSRRSYTKNLKVGHIPDEMFPSPADLEIPRHSVTILGEGERMLSFKTDDGLTLEGKLSAPAQATKPVPVVFFLPGAGPWTFDRPIQYPDLSNNKNMFPTTKVYNYCDFFAQELTKRAIAFFRINKRGCGIIKDKGKPREIVNRSIFSKATPSVLLADYYAALREMRKQSNVDHNQIILLGGSEGTRLAPRLALKEPKGIAAIVMLGYAEDNTKDIIVWQNTIGPWRNIANIFDTNDDYRVTREEYDETVKHTGKILSESLPFARLDRDENGVITASDVNHKYKAKTILKAVDEKDDDFLWDNLVNLSSAYLLEDWQCQPNHVTLLKLNMPLAIFHGENDGTCRVEGVRETKRAFEKAKKENLFVKIYPQTNHDLNWGNFLKDGNVPEAFKDVFDYIDKIVGGDY